MLALNKKAFRDLWDMKGQALAIALVIASGVATYLMSVTTLDSLRLTQATYYRDYRFADVFASLKRAPESLKRQIEGIPGVAQAQTRVRALVNVQVEGFDELVRGQMVSVPDSGQPVLNGIFLRSGRMVDPTRDDEVVVSDSFAAAHGLQPGDSIYATINGRRKQLRIVGRGLSPEFIFEVAPGAAMPNFKTFGTFWMARTPLATAYDMKGAFNDVTLRITQGVNEQDVIDRLDALLARYGGQGAYGRADQTSHRYLSEEFRGLENMAFMFPVIFLGVAAFLLNVVISRLMATQREQIAILKAFGYSNTAVVGHFVKMVALIVTVGIVVGVGGGVWLGGGLGRMYMEFYRFPYLDQVVHSDAIVNSALISFTAAILGTLYAVIQAAKLPPAEAMQPAAPPKYSASFLEAILPARLSQPTRMIVRNIERRPVKAALTVVGTAFASAILVMGGFFSSAMDYMVNIQFNLARADDVRVTFTDPIGNEAIPSLEAVPGIEYAEGFRAVPARLRFEHRSYRTAVQGIPPDAHLEFLLNRELKRITLPPEGLIMTDYLANQLHIQPGDMLTVEVLEGRRPVLQVPLAGVVSEWIGVSAYMQLPALNRLMEEGNVISGAYLSADEQQQSAAYQKLRNMPRVVGASVRHSELQNFYEIMANQTLVFAFVNTLLASTIAFGVVYNSARIALSERGRELASLRVLGFTRGEIGYILLGELFLLTLVAIPVGFVIGNGLCAWMVSEFQTDLYRVPLIVVPDTYSLAATVVLVSAVISALIMKRKLDRLDLVAVLKTKE